MKHRLMQALWLWVVAAVVLGAAIAGVSIMAHAQSDQRVPMVGQTVPLLKQAKKVGEVNAGQTLNLSIGLRLQNEDVLLQLLQNVYNPHSAQYHHFLTPQQFADQFSPTLEQRQQVVDYLHNQSLAVDGVASNGLLVNAHGTAAQVEAAFQVQVHQYQLGSHAFYANANAPTIPAFLSTVILSVGGLDNSVQLHPLTRQVPTPRAGFAQPELAGAYDINPLYQAGVQGKGQTVAVFELDGYQPADISQFATEHHISQPSLSNVLVDGYDGSANAGAIEAELDIEVLNEIAPQAQQLVYEGPNSTQGVNDTYNRIVTDNQAQVVSVSWGECETQSGAAELQTLDGIFKQAAAQGISIFSASGDSGAYDCNDQNLAVDSPASDPYVTGVGGTNLQLGNGGTYGSESAWSSPTDTQRSPNGAGGGGGLSNTFSKPTWQVAPGVDNQYSNGMREVPDVSADADPASGYAVYCTVAASGCPSSGDVTVGGTSAAAPLWAGSAVLINDFLQQHGQQRVGWVNPLLYQLANSQQTYAPFHDVTSGNNLYYSADANYDLATGLGSPDVYNIARDGINGAPTGNAPDPTPTVVVAPTDTPVVTTTPVQSPATNAQP
ncbi:S53 family peptidase [Dictyobacter kobayashii]|uniref:Pseudomonapepsin n=1 Tax=Dictyobacter kobayashii TaxID=2014872 RepID=A0A402AES8_9CHLR|nr:S53 family peptidase [Dictyobacter kobayashii]GCE17618.1 pseudomonapepsin [Dictyobacter kobayashii]